MTAPDIENLFTYVTAAKALSCAEITLQKAVGAGRLKCLRIGSRTVRFTSDQLRDYVGLSTTRLELPGG